ncbi:ROK family protein [uncultured Robinsoniella sp.]|uniref:ROK family protein n=1 Tax=uncultured Robinsoniella sp. TaxID=904190 RepID=UPI00374FBE33
MKKSGLNLIGVKEYNRALILQLIATGNGTTRNSLAQRSKLTSMTLTNITSELLQQNIIAESEASSDSKNLGRTPKILTISPTSPVVAGIWISKDFLFGILSDLSLKLVAAKQEDFEENETSESILEKTYRLAEYLLHLTERPVLGIGISTIGVVDTIHGVIKNVTNFFDIKEMDIKSYMSNRFDIPVYVKNDMQAAALCEMYYGIGQQKENFLYIGITNGIASAIVSNKQLLNNLTGSCGELGHTTIDFKGPKCNCGNRGCLELYASAPVIIKRINEACGTKLTTFKDTMEYCTTSVKAYSILQNISDQLAYALNNLINIIDISTVVFGHSAVYFPDEILASIAYTLNQISIFRNNRTITLHKTKFEENSPLYGSVCVVLDQLFTGNLTI